MTTSVQGFARDLALGLLNQQWQPQHLSPSQAHDAQRLTEQCLQEGIALREAGQAKLSLELLHAAEQAGLRSPWLLDNQARALVSLGQRQAAWQIWQRLLEHSDASVAQAASGMAELQETTLLNALGSLCAREGWGPRHLRDAGQGSLLERVLQEIITARENHAAQLSLALAEETLAQGWHDPWLLDNQARALVHLQREAEALPIWEHLQRHQDANAASTASEMVALYRQRVQEQQLLERTEQLQQQGNTEQAQQLLVDALAQAPTADGLRQRLGRLLHEGSGDLLSRELEQHAAELAVHERLLDALEHQLNQQAGG